MKSYRTKYSTALVALIALAFIFIGCSTDTSMAPRMDSNGMQVESNTGTVTLLKMKPNSLAKGEGSTYSTEQLVTAAEGGTVVVGNSSLGWSKIVFQPNDLPEDLTISLSWGDDYCDGIFGPHGTQFNEPVRVELSYKDADLTGIDEESLQIYYYNESSGIWEFIGGDVDTQNKVVVGYLEHFSRYAIVKT